MSMTGGYDALDELYERLRGQEEAQRAGGITPETIRAARGGVAGGHRCECHVVDENAAGGDSAPLVDISRDSRERIEADAWEAARLDMSRTWEERRDAIVALLDRQAALTEREWDSATANERIVELRKKVNALAVERDELRARLDLELTPYNMKFTQHDRESIERDLERLAQAVGQMNAGQKGKCVNFDEIPHIMARIAVACMHMKLSGALDRLEVDE